MVNNKKVTDHHAILPTLESCKRGSNSLSGDKEKVFALIVWKMQQAVQPPYIYENVLVTVCCQDRKFTAKYKNVLQAGHTAMPVPFAEQEKSKDILFRIQEAEERRLRLYEDYKAEILDEDEYSQLKEHYIAEKQRLEHELQKQRQRALELEKRIKICDAQMERMRGILNQNEFDEELVHELIKRIYVGMDNSVEVEFKCSDPYQEVLAIMSEVQNE